MDDLLGDGRRSYSHEEVLAAQLKDPEFRAEWERTAVPRALALYLMRVRRERGLTETEFARQLGMSQPAYARLDLGEHVPTIKTLKKIANVLGVAFRIDIRPDDVSESTEIVELPADVTADLNVKLEDEQICSAAD